MLYIEDQHIEASKLLWKDLMSTIKKAAVCIDKVDYAQPIKPYLRYRNMKNRIIAMPAFLGGDFNLSGIKWIASFPSNLERGLPRAHCITILNDADTGVPIAVVNTTRLSILRTTAVSGTILEPYIIKLKKRKISVGIIGWGPIAKSHYNMCVEHFKDQIDRITIYDIRPVDIATVPEAFRDKTYIAESWKSCYCDTDVVITCTVSDHRYIDIAPQKGTLLLNVSLRDYKADVYEYVKNAIVVDDWNEVCRENTDVELFHKECGLSNQDVSTICDVICRDRLEGYSADQAIMFNPMGMAAFDIAIGKHIYDEISGLSE